MPGEEAELEIRPVVEAEDFVTECSLSDAQEETALPVSARPGAIRRAIGTR